MTQVQFLPVVVRLRLCYEPGLRHLGHLRHLGRWGQENACREEGQELKRLRQVEGRFAVGELAENFEEMGHLGH